MIINIKSTTAGELYFDTPVEMIEQLNLKVGDNITWVVNENGTVTINRSRPLSISTALDKRD